MAAKDNREKRNFQKASDARNTVIHNLKDCKSYERLQDIIAKLEKGKSRSQSPFKIANLTESHTATIKSQDNEIAKLIQLKTAQFPKPVVNVSVVSELTSDTTEETVKTDLTVEVDATDDVVKADTTDEPELIETTEETPVDLTLVCDMEEYSPGYDETGSADKNPISGVNQSEYTGAKNKPQIIDRLNLYFPLKNKTDEFNHERAQELWKVRDQLDVLKNKMKAFYKTSDTYRDSNQQDDAKIYWKAALAARVIHLNISMLCADYEHNKIDLQTFQSRSKEFLNGENHQVAVLNTHRGYKDVIANLLIAITGVGLLAIAAASIYNGRFTMFKVTGTDAGSKVNALKDTVEHVQESPVLK
jgi:hypothetical protein